MKKRLVSVALSMVFLLSSVFFCPNVGAANSRSSDKTVTFFLDGPSTVMHTDTFEITVRVNVPEGLPGGGIGEINMTLLFDREHINKDEDEEITVNPIFTEQGLGDAVAIQKGILFTYGSPDTLLNGGDCVLFTAKLSLEEGAPVNTEYNFKIQVDLLIDNETFDDIDFSTDEADINIYVNKQFVVTPNDEHIYEEDTIELKANETVSSVRNLTEDIISYQGKDGDLSTVIVTGLSPGCGTLEFSSNDEETALVNIYVDKDSAQITSITVSNAQLTPEFKSDVYQYSALIPNEYEKLEFEVETEDPGADVTITNPTLSPDETGEVVIDVRSGKTGKEQKYTISVKRSLPSNADLKNIVIPGANIIPGANLIPEFRPYITSYTVDVKYTVEKLPISYEKDDEKATAVLNNPPLVPGKTTDVTITVTAQDKTTVKVYTISVTRAAPPYPEKSTSSKYTIDDTYISKIPVGTTVSALLSDINEREYLKVYHADGTAAKNNETVGTGFTVRIEYERKVIQTLTVVVTGDINGDGKITGTDYVNVMYNVLGKTKLTGAYSTAADINGDGKITGTDYVNIKFHVLKKSSIKPR